MADILKRIVRIVVVVVVTIMIIHPMIWLPFGWLIVKILLALLLAGIVARVVFKKSILDIILGDGWRNRDD